MAAPTLALTYVERNDCKLLTLTDVTTDWATADVDVNEVTTLTLDVEITTSDNVTKVYNPINLITVYPTTQADLVFQLDATDLVETGGSALGTAADVFPDGIYKFTYSLDVTLSSESILQTYVLIEGNVRNSVYEAMRTIPTLYMCNECKSKQILDAIFAYGYLNAMRAGGYVAKTEELISQLYVLERLLNYGSSYSW
jgi:hypothetical protein